MGLKPESKSEHSTTENKTEADKSVSSAKKDGENPAPPKAVSPVLVPIITEKVEKNEEEESMYSACILVCPSLIEILNNSHISNITIFC